MREFDGQDHGLFQCLLGPFEAGHILPSDVGLLGEDGAGQRASKLFGFGIEFFVVRLGPAYNPEVSRK